MGLCHFKQIKIPNIRLLILLFMREIKKLVSKPPSSSRRIVDQLHISIPMLLLRATSNISIREIKRLTPSWMQTHRKVKKFHLKRNISRVNRIREKVHLVHQMRVPLVLERDAPHSPTHTHLWWEKLNLQGLLMNKSSKGAGRTPFLEKSSFLLSQNS